MRTRDQLADDLGALTLEKRAVGLMEADARTVDGTEALARALAVRAAVLELPRRQRQAIVARHYLSLSVKEAALAMGCADGTVTALTHQAIANLRASKLLTGPDTYEDVEHGIS